MQPADSGLGHILLALQHHVHLIRHIGQPPEDLAIPIRKSVDRILNTRLLAELTDQGLHSPQVVTRNLREQVVYSLELQASVDEVQPFRAVDVHGSSQLALRERLSISKISRRHGPMGQSNLDMQRHSYHV